MKSEIFNSTLTSVCTDGQSNKGGIDARAYAALLVACMALRVDKGALHMSTEDEEGENDDNGDDLLYVVPMISSLRNAYADVLPVSSNAKVKTLNDRSPLWLIFECAEEENEVLDLCGLTIKALLLKSSFSPCRLRELCVPKSAMKPLENLKKIMNPRFSASALQHFFVGDKKTPVPHALSKKESW